MTGKTPDARALALAVLGQVEDGAWANAALHEALEGSDLEGRDRAFATELVYGVCRMTRACDYLVDRFVLRDLDGLTRAALRLGAYQLHYLGTPAHAGVSATVEVAPRRSRGLVNAILRRVSQAPVSWPDAATELSYPNWVVTRLSEDLGEPDALAALAAMNETPSSSVRADGYVQDRASQWVADALETAPGERVADLCAAPGGKSTALAGAGARVLAGEVDPLRAKLVVDAARRTNVGTVSVVIADGRNPPWPSSSFDRVLVDAPCSGLGVLHRRPDARWRRQPGDVERLAVLQRQLLGAARELVRPGGTLVYSACTLTSAETSGIDHWLAEAHPEFDSLAPLAPPWRPLGRGSLLLPQAAGTDGMFVLRLRLPSP